MNWLSPLPAVFHVKQRRAGAPPDTSRAVRVLGQHYPSLTVAARALGCSITKVYHLIGEGWRFR